MRHRIANRPMNYLKNGVVTQQHIRGGEQRRQNVKTFAKPPGTLVFFSAKRMGWLLLHQDFLWFSRPAAVPASSFSCLRKATMLEPPFTLSPTFTATSAEGSSSRSVLD